MIGLLLGIAIALSPEASCESIHDARKAAFDIGDDEQFFTYVDREIECIARGRSGQALLSEPGSLRSLCLPLDAAFSVANRGEHRPERAQAYLRRYEAAGCLADPLQRPRHRTNQALYLRRQLDDAGALRHLRWGEAEAAVAWLRYWDAPGRWSLLWSMANSMAVRAEIAAELRRPDDLRELVAAASDLLDSVDPAQSWSAAADVRNQLGWSMLMAHEAGVETDDPTELLEAALYTFVDERDNPGKANNTRINLALAALQHGSLSEAKVWIDEVERCGDERSDDALMWLRIVEIRRTIARGEPWRSAQWQDDLERIGDAGGVALGRWYAQATAGRRQEAMGDADAALLAYERAEAELESYASSRRDANEAILAGRRHLTFSDSTRRLVALLCERGDDDRALRVVRAARSRALRIADVSRLGGESLANTARPSGDQLRLVFFQTSRVAADGSSDWAGFALTATGLRVEELRLGSVADDLFRARGEDLEPFSAALLEPFSAEIEAAGSVEVLATGSLHYVPFHVLPWRGRPLIQHVAVTYGLDLAPAAAAERREGLGVALVLHGNERGLEGEANVVSEMIERGGTVPVRSSPSSAEELAAQLRDASIAHFAVHGTRTLDRGLLRSDDRLHFGRGLELSREAILDGGVAPRLVYLSACQSSFADGETLSGGIGLTQAFLLRGAHHVIGAVDDIDEEVAEDFAVAFYRALGELPGDVPGAWRRAYLDVRKTLTPSLVPHLHMLRLYSR